MQRSWALLVAIYLGLSPGAQAEEPRGSPLCPQGETSPHCPALVVEVRDGWIFVEANHPLRVGERFTLFSQRPIHGIDPVTRKEGLVPEGEETGMLVLERAQGDRGAGRLLRNAYAEPGDLAVPTTERLHVALWYGRRHPRTWRLTVDAWMGPVLEPVERPGFGLIALTAIEYRFSAPLKLALELLPVTLAAGVQLETFGRAPSRALPPTFFGALRGVVGLALSGFELSAGFGGTVDTGRAQPADLQVSFSTRFGSLDGLNIGSSVQLFLPGGSRSRLSFDSAQGVLQVPVHRRFSLTLHGGGSPQWLYGSLGFRLYAHGTGAPGTWIAGGGIGGGFVTAQSECPPPSTDSLTCVNASQHAVGPLFHLGIDRRF